MLNPMMMNVIMRTILKTDRNSFEDNVIKLKNPYDYIPDDVVVRKYNKSYKIIADKEQGK